MATTWIPMTRFDKIEWLLANGDVITEPPLEQTSTGLKVRVAGTTASFFTKDLDVLLNNAATTIAKERQSRVLCNITGLDNEVNGYVPKTPPVFFTGTQHREETKLWWKFTHPQFKYSVHISAQMIRAGENYTLTTSLIAPASLNNRNGQYPRVRQYNSWYDYAWAEQLQSKVGWENNGPSWTDTGSNSDLWFGETRQFIGKVAAYKALLALVQKMEGMDYLDFPDLEPGQGVLTFMQLEQEGTNLPPDFRADLQDHLDNSPDSARLKELYEEMIVILKRTGVVVSPDPQSFLAAVEAKLPIRVPLGLGTEPDGGRDYSHQLALDVASGTYVVECGHQNADRDLIAEEWEQAKTIAALTGEEDELLAYAREYSRRNASGKTVKVMKERGLRVPK